MYENPLSASNMQKSELSKMSSLISMIKPNELSETEAISLANGYYAAGISTLNNVFMYVWQPKSGSAYIYRWNANNNQWELSQTITNLVKGAEEPQSVVKLNYITWKDTGASSSVTAVGSDPTGSLTVNLVVSDTIYLSRYLPTSYDYTAYATGGVQPYSFVFTPQPELVNGSIATYDAVTLANLGVNTIDITVTVTDKNGTQAKATITVNLIKELTVRITGPSSLRTGDTGTYSASVSGGSGSYSYQFYVDGSPISTSNPASYTFNTTGSYSVSVTVTDLKTGAQGKDSMSVSVSQQMYTISPQPLAPVFIPTPTPTPKPTPTQTSNNTSTQTSKSNTNPGAYIKQGNTVIRAGDLIGVYNGTVVGNNSNGKFAVVQRSPTSNELDKAAQNNGTLSFNPKSTLDGGYIGNVGTYTIEPRNTNNSTSPSKPKYVPAV